MGGSASPVHCRPGGPSSVVDTTVAGMFHIRMAHGSRTSDSQCSTQHLYKLSIGVGSEHHSLLRAVQGEAAVEQLGALLAPVVGPVCARGPVAVEAGEDVE